MKSFPEVSTLQLYLNLFHGWRRRRLRAWATRCKVRMGAKWAGCSFCQHLCVWPSALLWICKVNIPGKTLQLYLLWVAKGGKRKANKGGAKEQINGQIYICTCVYIYSLLWFMAWFGALGFHHDTWNFCKVLETAEKRTLNIKYE